MRHLLSAAAVFLAASSAVAAPPEQKKSDKGLTYSIRMPDKYMKGQHTLVVALHGAGDNCGNFMRWLTSPECTIPKDTVLVAPQALADGAWDKADVEPVLDLVKTMKADHAPTRTILCGFSRGGYFTFQLGTLHPELFDGAIPCSGGLPNAVPDSDDMRRLPFYVCHGDADNVVPVTESEKAVAALEKAKVQVKFDKIPGLKHTVDWAAVKRGWDWIAAILDDRQQNSDAEVGKKIAELEKALKAKSWDEAAKAFDALAKVPAKFAPKVAALAKANATSTEEAVALAAISVAGRCGADGVAALKAIPGTNEKLAVPAAAALGATGAPAAAEPLGAYLKTKSDAVATAAAEALAVLGGDAATAALVSGLANTEALLPASPRKAAILEALKKNTGQSFAKASEWKKWLAEGAKK